MYLSKLYIENYRSIKQLDINFTEWKNVIVWKNNAGKSNIISAIDLVLWESSPTYSKSSNVSESDFFQKETWNTIFIFCELKKHSWEILDFSKISSSAIFKISDKDPDDKYGTIDRKFNIDLPSQDVIFQFSWEDWDNLIDDSYKKQWIGWKKYCKKWFSNWNFNDEFYWIDNFAFAFRAFINPSWKIEKEIVFLYKKEVDANWFISPQTALRDVIFQSAIIPSFRDPSTQLKISNWWWYWKILREKIKTTEDLEVAFDSVNKASEWIFSTVTSDVFDWKLQTAFPGTKARFSLAPLNQDIYKQALIYIDDGFESTLQSKWSWIQSAVIISLFDYYIKNIVDRNGGALLAVEEPELFLHPHGRRVIAHRLEQFIGSGTDKKNQVIITTHASEFIAVANNNLNVISVRKESWETQANNFNFWNDKKIRQILLRPQNTELFFADFVILTEDAKLFIEEIAREMGSENLILWENWLNDNNISVVNSGWKQEFWKFAKICEELNIPYLILADFDFLRNWVSEYYTRLWISNTVLNWLKGSLSFIAWKSSSDYKIITDLDSQSKIDYETKVIPEINSKNIYLLNWELENLYKLWKEPSIGKEQWVIETLGNLDWTNKLSDFILDTELRNILISVIETQWIRSTKETVEVQSQEGKVEEVIVRPVATLSNWEDPFRTKYPKKEDEIDIDDIPF